MKLLLVIYFHCFCLVAFSAEDPWNEYFGTVNADEIRRHLDIEQLSGLHVVRVSKGQVAEHAGLQVGDIIVGLNGVRFYGHGENSLLRWRENVTAEEPMILNVVRGKDMLDIEVWPEKFRRMGFNFKVKSDDLCRRISAGSKGVIDASDPLVYRSWRQFPMRYSVALIKWLEKAERSDEDLRWLGELSKMYVSLCTQDFAAAATISVQAPTPALQELAVFYQALAQRHKNGEQDPDPSVYGLSLLRYVNIYPYPLFVGPEVGELPDSLEDLENLLNEVRYKPGSIYNRNRQKAYALAPDMMQRNVREPAVYVQILQFGLADPDAGIYRTIANWLIHDAQSRKRVIAYLKDQLTTQPEQGCLLGLALTLSSYLEERNKGAKRLEQAVDELLLLKETSPAMAYLGLEVLNHMCNHWMVWNTRLTLREAHKKADFQTTLQPSVFIRYASQREAWLPFTLIGRNYDNFTDRLDRVYLALSYEKNIEELDEAIASLTDDTDGAVRRELLKEFVLRYRGWITAVDVEKMEKILGENKAFGDLLDMGPLLFRHAERHMNRGSFVFPIRHLLRNKFTNHNFQDLQKEINSLKWSDPQIEIQVHDIYRGYGSLFGTLIIADVCRDKRRQDLADLYYAKVDAYLDAEQAVAESMDWNKWWRDVTLWQRCYVYASSKYQTEKAIDAGWEQMNSSNAKSDWNATALLISQSFLQDNNNAQAIELLELSFSGRSEGGDTEPFIWPEGVSVYGMKAQRHKIIKILQDRGALNDKVLEGIRSVVNIDYVNDASLAILKMSREKKEVKVQSEKSLDDF